MYLDYWQLNSKPFEPASALDNCFACESQDGALSKLRYAFESGRPLAALAGPSGVGKTLLVHRLGKASGAGETVHLVFPDMSGRDLLAYLAERLGAPQVNNPTGSIEESVRRLEELSENPEDRRRLVIIDEAHLLEDTGALETLRLLSNFISGQRPAFTMLLVGQMGLLSSVARRPALDERLSVKTLLRGFTAEEAAGYVRWRLEQAGSTRQLFEDSAIDRLFEITGGNPRQLDRLCDLSLVVGMADGIPTIGIEQIESVQRELVSVGVG